MMLQKNAGGGYFMKKQILRGIRDLSKLLRDESHREAVAFFQKILLFSSCFEAVNSNPPPPGVACVAKLTPEQHKTQISAVLKAVFIC